MISNIIYKSIVNGKEKRAQCRKVQERCQIKE